MDHPYPAGPQHVPENFTVPTSSYKRHAWLAMLLLCSFVAAYLALSGWFVITAWRMFTAAFRGGDDAVWAFISGGCAAFLAVFMLKALFFVRHSYEIDAIEITPQQEPRLFAFLNRLADEAKAPRAHRVFLSPQVNAAVFYDLSILNLILPSKKNLDIGLGLVNVLSLGEFKAVLAHEFGHFAQRSMAVGRWVYIAQQIAGHIISTRDVLDSFLSRLSHVDFRVAWIGWVLSLVVWSIRSVMETFFRLVIIAQRALSREMEFQADLVSVSLTGSDALIHALHRLQVADDAWDRTLHFGSVEAQSARPVADLFAVQHRIIHHMRTILGKPEYGSPPAMPQQKPDQHRIFKLELAQTPRMWATHPSNTDREANAKKTYIPADIDDGPVWDLFQDPSATKERMSQHIFKAGKDAAPPAPADESLKRLDERYERAYLQPGYRGVYLGRSVVRHAASPAELYVEQSPGADLLAALDSLYPESVTERLEHLRELHDELNSLEALRLGVASAPGGVLQHRGRQLQRAELPVVISQLREEVRAAEQIMQEHDRLCRSTHIAAARRVGMGWDEYLRGLIGVLHYADHSEADLRDVQGLFVNVYTVVTADRKVSEVELDRLIGTANRVFVVLQGIYEQAGAVSLDSRIRQELETESWAQMLGEFKLIKASKENISDWLGVIDGWVNATAGALGALQMAALNQLLLTEADVAGFLRQGVQPPEAPSPSIVPKNYPVLLPGKERERQTSLDAWSRFQTADGLVPTLARLGVAGAIMAAVLLLGGSTARPTLTVYNGLDTSVRVTLGSSFITLGPFATGKLETPGAGRHTIIATAADGQVIESFETTVGGGPDQYVYNVAAASPLFEWTAVYGGAAAKPNRDLGAVRWTTTTADVLFSDPPASISGGGSGGTRDVLAGLSDADLPGRVVAGLDDVTSKSLIAAHARWDNLKSRRIMNWLTMAARDGAGAAILQMRLKESPRNPMLLRLEQDFAAPEARPAVCQRHASLLAANNEPNLQYITDRCIESPSARDAAFIKHYNASPQNPWLALAAGYSLAEQSKWDDAAKALDIARQALPETGEFVAMDLARIKRMTDGEKAVLDLIARDSTQLGEFLVIEKGGGPPGPLRAYQSLAAGRLDEAMKQAAGSAIQSDMSVLAAASEGASPELAFSVLAQPVPEDLPQPTAWFLLGLAASYGRDTAPYSAVIVKELPEVKEWIPDFDRIVRGNTTLFETHVAPLSLREKGYAYAAAVIVLGNRAPAEWREAAKRLLFKVERPYFK